jgi:hypothetical protein
VIGVPAVVELVERTMDKVGEAVVAEVVMAVEVQLSRTAAIE